MSYDIMILYTDNVLEILKCLQNPKIIAAQCLNVLQYRVYPVSKRCPAVSKATLIYIQRECLKCPTVWEITSRRNRRTVVGKGSTASVNLGQHYKEASLQCQMICFNKKVWKNIRNVNTPGKGKQ